jgi:hypothetical protein
MKILPDGIGRFSTPITLHNRDALAPICEINEQCLHMLASAARQARTPSDSFIHQLFSLIGPLDSAAIKAAARFPFLLVDFGFRDARWWHQVTSGHGRSAKDFEWLAPLPRAPVMKLARATLTLAWHTVRTDAETSLVLLGITPEVSPMVSALRLQDIDQVAERYFRRVRPRWEDRPAVWRQLLTCAMSTEVDSAHEFVLHALQLTAAASLPRLPSLQPHRRRSGSTQSQIEERESCAVREPRKQLRRQPHTSAACD